MKTKHLFFTMALGGLMAACTNEDFLENGVPQGSTTGQERPVISGVTLGLNEAETRVGFDGNGYYQFTDGDKISALLMDENNTGIRYGITTNTDEWNKLTWLEKYHLVDYVHTNFPFEREDGIFSAKCNMLEGNYFLTYPYTCLDGNRQARIDLAKQEQIGNSDEGRKNAILKNQRFIGYAQLKAGEGVSDFNAQLRPILAPVRFSIQSRTNVGTPLDVTKIVISHPKLTGTLTIDPTRAFYGDAASSGTKNWNLLSGYVLNNTDSPDTENPGDIWHFNYANFLAHQPVTAGNEWKEELYENERYGSTRDEDYVYNVKGEACADVDADEATRLNRKPNTYYWDDAIRAVVQPMREFNNSEYATQYVEVYTKDTETADCMTLAPNKTIEVVAMLPAFQGDESPILLTIYTKQGIIKDIDLSKQHIGAGTDVQTSGILDRVDPTDKDIQRIEVVLDNPAIVQFPTDVVINNENDLLQWVTWLNDNADGQTGNKNPIARFTNDIVIDDELAEAILDLRENYILSILSVAAPGNNLKIATTTEENSKVLKKLDVASNVTVEVMAGGTLTMTEDSYNIAHQITSIPGYPENPWGQLHIEVAEGGRLNIISNDKTAIQGGFDAAGQPVANRTEVLIKNMGTINVENETEILGFYIVNEGMMYVKKSASLYFAPNVDAQSKNTIKGTIVVTGTISGSTNNNFVNEGKIKNGSETTAGKIYNIINQGNNENLKPGLITIMNQGSYTDLSSCSGTVDYQSYLTGVHFNNTLGKTAPEEDAEFIYTGKAGADVWVGTLAEAGDDGLQVSDLNAAYVTDATITEGTLITDMEGETTLENLTIKGSAGVKGDEKNRNLVFNKVPYEGVVKFEGTSWVEEVSFRNLSVTETQNAIIADQANVTFKKTVAFWEENANSMTKRGGLFFENAKLTVERNAAVHAENLYAIDGTKSDVYNDGAITLASGSAVQNNVTVHSNQPNR